MQKHFVVPMDQNIPKQQLDMTVQKFQDRLKPLEPPSTLEPWVSVVESLVPLVLQLQPLFVVSFYLMFIYQDLI